MRLIDADALYEKHSKRLDSKSFMISHVDIFNAPTVDPVTHGYWIRDGHHIICSQCETAVCNRDYEGDSLPMSYCMHCGAKMDLSAIDRI